MNGEKKAFMFLFMLTIVCISVMYTLLFVALWQYRFWVGISLLSLLAILVAVFVRGRIYEQNLRVVRFRHNEETPLDEDGEPRMWRSDMQENPYRMPVRVSYYQGYRSG